MRREKGEREGGEGDGRRGRREDRGQKDREGGIGEECEGQILSSICMSHLHTSPRTLCV